MATKGQSFLKAFLFVAAGKGLSGSVYDVGLGFASDGYYDDEYGCDPSGGYDAYYDCDYGYAFSNIGFGGGWYDNYYYPGYGIFPVNNAGHRYPISEHYRRYWSGRRHNWYRVNRERARDGRSYQGRYRTYSDNTTPGAIGWPERNSANTVLLFNSEVVQRPGCGRGEGYGRPNRRGNDGFTAVAVPQQDQPRMRQGGSEGHGYRHSRNPRQARMRRLRHKHARNAFANKRPASG